MRKVLNLFFFVAAGLLVIAPVLAGGEEKAEDTDNKFSVHGEVRVRGEYQENYFDFDNDVDDASDFFPYRFRVAAKGDLGNNVWVYAEIQSVDIFGRRSDGPFNDVSGETITPYNFPLDGFDQLDDDDGTDAQFYQGWIGLKEIGGGPFSFKAGRFEMTMGTELLLGNLDFYSGVSHDGFMAKWEWDRFALNTFYTRVFEDSGLFDSPGDDEEDFWGGWANWTYGKDEHGPEVAVYAFNDRDDSVGSNFWTLGARTSRHIEDGEGFEWNAEYALQSGDSTPTVDKEASVFEGSLDYKWDLGTDTQGTVWVGYTMATGDEALSPTEDGDFDPLFQDFHYRLGLADLWVTTDIEAIEAGFKVKFQDKHKVGITLYSFTENEVAAGDDDLGDEIDLFYKYAYTDNVDFDVALANFSPGDSLTGGTPPDDAVMRLYGQIKARW